MKGDHVIVPRCPTCKLPMVHLKGTEQWKCPKCD